MRGGVASGTGLAMLPDHDMPEGLLHQATAALLDPGHAPSEPGNRNMAPCSHPVSSVWNRLPCVSRSVSKAAPMLVAHPCTIAAVKMILVLCATLCAACCSAVGSAAVGPVTSRQPWEPVMQRPESAEVLAYRRVERLQQQLEVGAR